METYFYDDPRIRKWINQIIERIFTVCILTGVGSDEEFQKGCQIVMKLTMLLQDIPSFPSEFLTDGVKQLIEQQLPDSRVINNFPKFQVTMDRMLHEGILKVTDSQKKEAFNSILTTVNTKDNNIKPHDSYTEGFVEASCIEGVTNSVLPYPAKLPISYSDIQHTKAEAQAKADVQALKEDLAQAEAQAKAETQALEEALAQAEAQAKADVQALEEALAQAEAQAKADIQALEEALAQAEAQTKTDAQAYKESLAQAEIHAKAEIQALEEALAQAEAQAKAETQALEETLAQAEAQAKADTQALEEALAQAEAQAKADTQALEEALAQAEAQTKTDAQAHKEALAQAEAQAKADIQALEEALTQAEQAKGEVQSLEEALAQAEMQAKSDALAFADALAQVETKLEAITKIERDELARTKSSTNDYFIEHLRKANSSFTGNERQTVELIKVSDLFTSIDSKISQLFSTSLVPPQADILGQVLTNIFPKGTVYWNKTLMGQKFLAQIEDILIYLYDPEHPCDLKKFNRAGWKVLVCSNEDLTFPRRLERQIRQIQRSGKVSATGGTSL
ncbi:hypothetical protein [Desulfosporosinus sp.]|uniref:hypothetical protein n=1 Tax=Desulfosporosinus sp. TaxID=157907 RepID=UPI002638A974|nr:hypothetical protein [Desulfosporosinus sp.]